MFRWSAIAGVLIPLLIIGVGARAADTSEVEQLREQLKSTVLQLRQLQDQQAQAPTPPAAATPGGGDAALKAKLSSLQAQLTAARRQAAAQAGSQAALAKANSDNAALTAAATANAAELDKFKGAYNQAQETNRTLAAERDHLKTQLTRATYVASVCKAKNDRLVAFAQSLLTAYNRVSFGDQVAAREPFMQLKRVQLENLAQNREDLIWAATCDTGATDAPSAAPPQAGAQPSSTPGF